MLAVNHNDPLNYADDNTLSATATTPHEATQKLVADGNISMDWFTQLTLLSSILWSQIV